MKSRPFFDLVKWELEEYLSFPMLELLIVVAVYSVFSTPILTVSSGDTYANLHWGIQNVFFFSIFVIGAIFARSFAGSLAKGETKQILSYPVKRWQLFMSKFTVLFLVISAVYCSVFSANMYLHVLSPLEPMLYVSMLGLILEILFFCSLSVTFSLIVKNEIVTILAPILLLSGVEGILKTMSYWSYADRFKLMFSYFSSLIHSKIPFGTMHPTTFEELVLSIAIPIGLSVLLLVLSLVYFTRLQELD
jgi:ABC-type transport system involved in multi-copper enzyme maturation permease subunit